MITADQVGIDQIFGRSAIAGLRGRLGRTLYDQIRRVRQAGQIGQRAYIAMGKAHAAFAQPVQVELRAAAVQVVESDHLRRWIVLFERQCHSGADETGASGDQDAVMRGHFQFRGPA